jgi:AcrR family transcriptional regulator
MRTPSQPIAFAPKKIPTQQRSRDTFEAVIGACTWLLPKRGYAGTTTNHIADRAGVNIASLYEYFPGKDAIVAQVAERLVDRVLQRLSAGAREVTDRDARNGVQLWIELIYDTVAAERDLVSVFMYQVPYTNQLEPIRAIGARLLEISHQVRLRAGGLVRAEISEASLHLLINLVTGTILQAVFDPPEGVSPRELVDELIRRVERWIADPI